ncbi:MAG: sulfide:quinone oxidoreductase [Benniella sp.]|nr:MAG: sulfide:quinone oxidoreductase [Benniella sp.]
MVLASLSPLGAVARMGARSSAFQSRRFLAQAVGATSKGQEQTKPSSYKVVVVGGGSAGLSVASTLSENLGNKAVAVIDPSDVHYYQPLWTFVGAGLKTFEESKMAMSEVMPEKAQWIKDSVASFDPKQNTITLANGESISYDYLVVAAGIQVNWGKIKNLPATLGKNGVTSNYSPDSVTKTDEFIKAFKGGNALFTMPSTPIKCAGAPQKIMYLAEEQWRKAGIRSQTDIKYFTGLGKIFAIDKYANELLKICKARNLNVNYFTDLAEVRPDSKEAVFNILAGEAKGTQLTLPYDFLHVTPPMSAPDFIKSSPLSNADGWVDVDKETLRHNKFANVYALGDCSSLPTSKTAAAITAQSAVLKNNLLGDIYRGKQVAKYDGYTSCPLITGSDKLILAEFSGYSGQPQETFPFDQSKERFSTYLLTKEIIPEIYWKSMLKGTWDGPAKYRKLFGSA